MNSAPRPLALRQPLAKPAFSNAVHPVLQKVFAARGLSSDAELVLGLDRLLPPSRMQNLQEAAVLLASHVASGSRILVVADFDADGATSCALLLRGLALMGCPDADFLVPNRFEFGYGLTPEIVELAAKKQPHLLITVDNGISSLAGVALARSHGMQVLVTDHHLPGATLPDADVIINPNQKGCGFPSKALAGVGVVFYLLAALRTQLRESGWFSQASIQEPNLALLLDLVALGTVADVVPLDANNRILVKHGLQLIRSGRGCPGIRALLEVGGRNPASAVATDLGFAAGPRLNAAGRLDDMSIGICCLLADDAMVARQLAMQLDAMNKERKAIEGDMRDDALQLLQEMQITPDHYGICLYNPGWHQGVIGILASRIKEKLHRPVIIFADAGEEQGVPIIKGSARSIGGVHIRDVLDRVATRHPEILQRFGGHAMAAGLTISLAHLDAFINAFDTAVQDMAEPEVFNPSLLYDGELERSCFSLDFAMTLREAGPWGQHFPEPLFTGNFRVASRRVLGDKHLKLVLSLDETGSQLIDAIAFNQPPEILHSAAEVFTITYRLDVNEFRGELSAQLMVEQIEPVS
jgi:single-stranded-DNA-specific exonuclease